MTHPDDDNNNSHGRSGGWVQATTLDGSLLYINMDLTWALIPSASHGTQVHAATLLAVKKVVDGEEVEVLETLNQRVRQTPQELFAQLKQNKREL